MSIKNLLFDLGGVIINIDYNLTVSEFHKVGGVNIKNIYNKKSQDKLFEDYETGKISSTFFRKSLNAKLGIAVDNIEFDKCWNAMLLDIPLERLNFIKLLRKKYNVFLFSNINEIHLQKVVEICHAQNGFDNFKDYFVREYYSHILGQRKPVPNAFLTIINENNLNAKETLFIDDAAENIRGAAQANLHGLHITKDINLFSIPNAIEKINQLATEKK